jgi:hypothetical protein
MDIQTVVDSDQLTDLRASLRRDEAERGRPGGPDAGGVESSRAAAHRSRPPVVEDEAGDVSALIRRLARDDLRYETVKLLVKLGDRALPALTEALRDDATDFVIRRRIPSILGRVGGPDADAALLDGLSVKRFEIRYRCAASLVRRRRKGLAASSRPWKHIVWSAVRSELGKERPVWELQKLLDGRESVEDGIVARRVGVRGELSLEHTFRLLALVLDPETVRAAFLGIVMDDVDLNSYALEYLEQVLPADIREKLWPFIGDVSAHERKKRARPLDQVVGDLLSSSATIFADGVDREALKKILEGEDESDA